MQYTTIESKRVMIQSFNTASGMDCMQSYANDEADKEIPIEWLFQYRKRYGLHAIFFYLHTVQKEVRFNTASGMDCMQSRSRPMMVSRSSVSIPQAVWIACNAGLGDGNNFVCRVQYRKRYGLHAIPSLTALGTAEPRSGFSKRNALFGKSPQPCGIFLSPKSAENVRKPCNIKETFVHGKNLKLMAFSPKALPSL